MATQLSIAGELGLDVSSVNKILNRVHGAKFRKETVKAVFAAAKRQGYRNDRATKGALRGILEELFPRDGDEAMLVTLRGVDIPLVRRIRRMLYGKKYEEFRL